MAAPVLIRGQVNPSGLSIELKFSAAVAFVGDDPVISAVGAVTVTSIDSGTDAATLYLSRFIHCEESVSVLVGAGSFSNGNGPVAGASISLANKSLVFKTKQSGDLEIKEDKSSWNFNRVEAQRRTYRRGRFG